MSIIKYSNAEKGVDNDRNLIYQFKQKTLTSKVSQNSNDSVFEFFKQGRKYQIVVKVCDQINGQKCPIFPMTHNVLDWNIEDPADIEGDYDERLEKTRRVRDEIKARVESFINEYKSSGC